MGSCCKKKKKGRTELPHNSNAQFPAGSKPTSADGSEAARVSMHKQGPMQAAARPDSFDKNLCPCVLTLALPPTGSDQGIETDRRGTHLIEEWNKTPKETPSFQKHMHSLHWSPLH
ncbi:unnamed protein product [Ixodes pacificus]